MKKICYVVLTAIITVLLFSGCSKGTKTVHCDNCGKEVAIAENSNMNDDWQIYCSDCEKELGLDKIVE